MNNLIVPLLGTLFSLFKKNEGEIAEKVGVDASVVGKITEAFKDHLGQDQKAWSLMAQELEKARQHDIATQVKGAPVIDFLRGAVRPCITYIAMFWYVYARMKGIPLLSEDYAIIGGILAFWFGMRPFEKIKKG